METYSAFDIAIDIFCFHSEISSLIPAYLESVILFKKSVVPSLMFSIFIFE